MPLISSAFYFSSRRYFSVLLLVLFPTSPYSQVALAEIFLTLSASHGQLVSPHDLFVPLFLFSFPLYSTNSHTHTQSLSVSFSFTNTHTGLTSNDTSTTGNTSTEVSGFSTAGVTTTSTNGRVTTGRGPLCKSLRVPLCHKFRVGYSYTSLPNSFGQFDQESISSDLMQFEKLFGVKCYSLLPLFICSIYAPKCIPNVNSGHAIPPCKSLCQGELR